LKEQTFKDILSNGVIRIYAGRIPESVNDAVNGKLLCTIKLNNEMEI